ncbi:hypothetical protein [Methanobrevibacter curvatus]|uniref:Uncharacterized protein n=1 Tax=Methanobrevibacter curvatus TaxID=49547 RepID=A0A166C8R8_9EURY|nr:hypothetical protein [Methanobrevibacter curvatus]KZX12257.1 hypothetical protein MBCUR_11090 [Methanobrevibacter curvatus]
MKVYYDNSNVVNDCLRNYGGKWNSALENKYGFSEKEFKNMVKNLDNSQIKFIKDTTIFKCCKDTIYKFEIDKLINENCFMSTSFDKGVSKYYGV